MTALAHWFGETLGVCADAGCDACQRGFQSYGFPGACPTCGHVLCPKSDRGDS